MWSISYWADGNDDDGGVESRFSNGWMEHMVVWNVSFLTAERMDYYSEHGPRCLNTHAFGLTRRLRMACLLTFHSRSCSWRAVMQMDAHESSAAEVYMRLKKASLICVMSLPVSRHDSWCPCFLQGSGKENIPVPPLSLGSAVIHDSPPPPTWTVKTCCHTGICMHSM